MSVRAQVYRTENGQWAARFVDDGNHQKLMGSETYVDKADAIRVLELVTRQKFGPSTSLLYDRRRTVGQMRVEIED